MSKKKLSPKQLRTRKKIIDVAIRLFVRFGIQGTSMQLLAKRADIATGSIYNYFENKEALIKEIFYLVANEETDYISIGYDDKWSVRKRFDYLIHRSIRYKIENPNKFRFRAQYVYTAGVMNDLPTSDTFEYSPFTHLGRTGVEEGLLKPYALEELFYFSHGGMSAVVMWRLFEGGTINETDIQHITDLIWDAISV